MIRIRKYLRVAANVAAALTSIAAVAAIALNSLGGPAAKPITWVTAFIGLVTLVLALVVGHAADNTPATATPEEPRANLPAIVAYTDELRHPSERGETEHRTFYSIQ